MKAGMIVIIVGWLEGGRQHILPLHVPDASRPTRYGLPGLSRADAGPARAPPYFRPHARSTMP